jgi:hypothetical protein
VTDRQRGNYRKAAPGSPAKAIAGAAMMGGMAAAGAAWAMFGPGAPTADATCTNCGPVPPTPISITMPNYGNILSQLPQSGLGINPQTCPGGACYQPIATTIFPISGQTYVPGSFPGCTTAANCTVPSTANNTYPLVANSSGTSTTIQLPVFMI